MRKCFYLFLLVLCVKVVSYGSSMKSVKLWQFELELDSKWISNDGSEGVYFLHFIEDDVKYATRITKIENYSPNVQEDTIIFIDKDSLVDGRKITNIICLIFRDNVKVILESLCFEGMNCDEWKTCIQTLASSILKAETLSFSIGETGFFDLLSRAIVTKKCPEGLVLDVDVFRGTIYDVGNDRDLEIMISFYEKSRLDFFSKMNVKSSNNIKFTHVLYDNRGGFNGKFFIENEKQNHVCGFTGLVIKGKMFLGNLVILE